MQPLFSSFSIKDIQSLNPDVVVLTTGTRPCNQLYQKAKSLGYEIHRIGDCLEARNAKAAIYEGAVLGRSL